jgi:hypothetical protein
MVPRLRCALSFALAVFLFLLFYHPFLPYSSRHHAQTGFNMVVIMAMALLTGLSFGIGSGNVRRSLIAASFLAGLFVSNVLLIGADWAGDPTSHNLFPFEFVILAILASPAFVGTSLSGWIDRARHARE